MWQICFLIKLWLSFFFYLFAWLWLNRFIHFFSFNRKKVTFSPLPFFYANNSVQMMKRVREEEEKNKKKLFCYKNFFDAHLQLASYEKPSTHQGNGDHEYISGRHVFSRKKRREKMMMSLLNRFVHRPATRLTCCYLTKESDGLLYGCLFFFSSSI